MTEKISAILHIWLVIFCESCVVLLSFFLKEKPYPFFLKKIVQKGNLHHKILC